MGTIRVIAGRYKGRSIPFPARKFNEAEITPQRVKGAVFSILGDDLSGRCFMDLFAGSGQIAVEALSRGADPVLINESDRARFQAVKSYIFEIGAEKQSLCLNMPALRALDYVSSRGFRVDVFFLDPPYDKSGGPGSPYDVFLQVLSDRNLVFDTTLVIIQHYARTLLTEKVGDLILAQTKKYGNTSLAVYRRR